MLLPSRRAQERVVKRARKEREEAAKIAKKKQEEIKAVKLKMTFLRGNMIGPNESTGAITDQSESQKLISKLRSLENELRKLEGN